MKVQNLFKQSVIWMLISILILLFSTPLVQAKDDQASPLFKESLHETLKEFDHGTVKIDVDRGPLGLSREVKVEIEKTPGNREITVEIEKKPCGREVKIEIDHKPCNQNERFPGRGDFPIICPTLRGKTCQGVRCYGFPTLVGNTCSTTCGVRSTCSSGRFCRIYPSPCAKADSPRQLAKGSEKPLLFDLF